MEVEEDCGGVEVLEAGAGIEGDGVGGACSCVAGGCDAGALALVI